MKKCIDGDESSFISDSLFQRLFRLFLLFAEPADPPPPSGTTTTTTNRALQHISAAQTHFLVNELFRLVRPRCSAPLHIPQQPDRVTFRELVELCDLVFPDRKQLEPVVDRIFDRYVSQIVNKGFVMCRKIPSRMNCSLRRSSKPWKSYWCTIVPGTVFLWPLHKKTTIPNRQEIVLDANSMVHMGTFEEDRFTWQLYTAKHKYQFGHFDEIQRQHWFSDMNLVIEYRNKSDLFNFDREFSKRNENIGKEKDCSWKLALESENQRLTQLLNEERQALYDEEIVRELATRMLDEERDRSEQFEKKMIDLETQLMHEQNTCAELRDHLQLVTGDANKVDDDISCQMHEQLNFGSCTPSSIYLDEYEVCNEDSGTPTPQPNQHDYLIISTQSI